VEATKGVYDQLADTFPPELIKRIRETKSMPYPYVE